MPRFSRLYRDVVMRPLAEQLRVAAGIGVGHSVLDVICDGGAATAEATRAVGESGSVIATDFDAESLPAARAMNSGSNLQVVECTRTSVPLEDASVDRAINLLTLGYADISGMLQEMLRVTKKGGRITVLSYGGANPVHERLFADAVAAVKGAIPQSTEPLLAQIPTAGMDATPVRDVVRFDGLHQYWDALMDGRGVLEHLSAAERNEVRERIELSLQRFIAADGTLRIPVDVVLLSEDR